jgi:protein-tyrosine phosphatase
MIKVLFVCLGNICRSPMAHAVFENKLKEQALDDNFLVDSCGLGSWHQGEEPDERTLKTLKNNGIEFSHPARTLSEEDFNQFDYLLGMDLKNMSVINEMRSNDKKAKVYLFRAFDKTDDEEEVPDPYWGNMNDFNKVYDIVDRTSDQLIDFLKRKHQL